MAIVIYDADKNPYAGITPTGTETARYGTLQGWIDGRNGGAIIKKIYLRNDDPLKYYTNIIVQYDTSYPGSGVYGDTSWSIKYIQGEREPTAAEWDAVASGDSVSMPDIGAAGAADTTTYYPLWVRIYAPAGTPAQIREDMSLNIYYVENVA